MKVRFTYRSLYRDKADMEGKAVWSVAPRTAGEEEADRLVDTLLSIDADSLMTPEDMATAEEYVRKRHPDVRRVRFDVRAIEPERREGWVVVSIEARLKATGADDGEFHPPEFDYYAAQAVMNALERSVG